MSILIDTSVLIDVQRAVPRALDWLAKQARTPLYVSSITVFELSVGADSDAGRAYLTAMLQSLAVIAVDEPIAVRAGEIWRRYRRSHGVDQLDAIIGATALVARLPLATLNTKHFPAVTEKARPY